MAKHLVMLEGQCALLDLSPVQGSMHDATISRVESGARIDGMGARAGGTIYRTDGTAAPLFDRAAVIPMSRPSRAHADAAIAAQADADV